MDLVRNIKKMYERSDRHVHVLAASIRTINHLLCSFLFGAELATVPSKVLQDGQEQVVLWPTRISSTKPSTRRANP
jgi:transaldolase